MEQETHAAGLPHLHHKLGKQPLGVITAFHASCARDENRWRSRKLLAQLLRAGLEVTAVEGRYREDQAAERAEGVPTAFIVADPAAEGDLEHLLCELGKAYDQDALVMVSAEGEAWRVGIGDRGNARPGAREKIGRVPPGADAVNGLLSRLFGRPFVLESVRQVRRPDTLFGRMALKVVAENGEWDRPDGAA